MANKVTQPIVPNDHNALPKVYRPDGQDLIQEGPTLRSLILTYRTKKIFSGNAEGSPWVLLDNDGVPVPKVVDAWRRVEEIFFVIRLLLDELETAICAYSFSKSAGIRNPDGSPEYPEEDSHAKQ